MTVAAYRNITINWEHLIARVTLSRPEKLNPLDWETVRELRRAIAEINNRPEIVVVIITGSGRSFSAGGDLEGYLDLYRNSTQFAEFLNDFRSMLTAIEESGKIFIAAVNGVCVAGGLELLLACDLAIAGDTARIGDGHLNFGQLPGGGGSQRLPRAIGLMRAKHLMLTGELLTAQEAERVGLVNKTVPANELSDAVAALVTRIVDKSRSGVSGAKHLANLTRTTDLADGLSHEISYVHAYATTDPDATEGLKAFKEKRKPIFST
jgi:enoyl-CoA hydratase